MEMSREDIIFEYFGQGYKYDHIQKILAKNGHKISLGHMKVLIKQLGLRRKFLDEDLEEIALAMFVELQESGKCLGYKSMWQRLKLKYGLDVYRETVLDLLHILDSAGVETRARYGIKRREYVTLGPWFCVHTDGYDKFKFAGLAVHACMDGYSRKCLWLEVGATNNKPEVIAHFYLKALQKYKVVPNIVRSDRGTENSIIELLQIAFRYDHEDAWAADRSFLKGKSTANQRVESFWGLMRRLCGQFWINYWKDMIDEGVFDKKNPIQLECLRFCFGPLVTCDLQQVRREWNLHTIRKSKFGNSISGKPNYLFNMPEEFGMSDCGRPVSQEQVNRALAEYAIDSVYCGKDFCEMVQLMMPNLQQPTTVIAARRLYHEILDALENLDDEAPVDMNAEGNDDQNMIPDEIE